MKFGKGFRTPMEETLPEWRDKFLCYKLLKKLLKRLPASAIAPAVAAGSLPRTIEFQQRPWDADRPLAGLQDWFLAILNEELEKLNDFYVDKEEEFVIRLQELKGRIELVKEKTKSSEHGVFTSESECNEEVMDIRKDFVTIHGEMVLLKHYSSLNFAGIVKILKKYDRRTGGSLRLPFTQVVVRQPFATTEPLMRLVRECEANLELLFPLEAEVIEATPPAQDGTSPGTSHSSLEFNDPENIAASQTPSNHEASEGLQKACCTCPLSFSNHLRNQDDDSTGAVTAENSTSNSAASLHSEEEVDQSDMLL